MPVKNHPQSCIYRFLPWHTNREVMKNVYAIQLPWNGKYFHTLPISVQESIVQSGVKFKNEEDMRAVVMQLVQRQGVQ